MVQRKNEIPSVATFADHEMITPPHQLRKAVAPAIDDDDDPVARAEAALVELSSEFASWMQAECERLETARQSFIGSDMTKDAHEVLFRVAHDIKGEAATFGYPEAAGIAESLCRLLEHTPDIERIPLQLIDQHVDAVRAITREHARPDLSSIADVLERKLRAVTDEFLRRENSFRPDYLENIFSPPLAPGSAGT